MNTSSCTNSGDHQPYNTNFYIHKRKRSKRQKLVHPPIPPPVTSSSSTSSTDFPSINDIITHKDEELYMANCLIFLAHGIWPSKDSVAVPRPTSDKLAGKITGIDIVYECKTCKKRFSSFQALGGHRTSHKKHKLDDRDEPMNPCNSTSDSSVSVLSVCDKVLRIHECSICGASFSSGQALGGHMRRHRPLTGVMVESPEKVRRERTVLSLDLNFPAPFDDDGRRSTENSIDFSFGGKSSEVLSPASLVDCHY